MCVQECKRIRQAVALAALVALSASVGSAASVHTLWYGEPAEDSLKGWEERSLPLGCGQFGVSVFGGIGGERLQLTENSVLTRRNLTNALDIRLEFPGHNRWNAGEYRRDLTLETGIASVAYTVDGVAFRREYFTSYPARTLALRLTASKKGALAFTLAPEIPFQRQFGIGKEAWIGREGHLHAEGNALDVTQHLQWYNVRFFGRFLVKTDGKLTTLDHTIEVADASEATIFFCCGTNYKLSSDVFTTAGGEFTGETERQLPDGDPSGEVSARVAAAAEKGWNALKAEHLADFCGLMRRAQVTLAGSDNPSDLALTTDKLLEEYGKGRSSSYLEETYFQYGRYLLVSSSRPGTLPANLQGVWTAHDKSPWGAGYWHNINVQMNYWPAFNCNLAECFQAYADFNRAFRPVTRRYAEEYLKKHVPENVPRPDEKSDCWCIGTASYPYSICGGPHGHSGPGTGGLTTKCFKDWYDYTLDETTLRDYVWPTLHGMADFLTRCVRDYDGEWLSVFSASPEQWAKQADGTWGYYHTVGCAFDQQMIHENNADTLELAKKLGVKDDVTARIERQLGHYTPVLIGESGQVKEYREEKKYGDIGEYAHRHISMLVGLYPGTIINKNRPDWMAAAKYSLTERSDESTGWALAHRLNCWARLGDGDHCHKLIRNLLGKRTYANLWDAHPPFQIDGNFGATSGIAEMLIQSHAGYIDLLPSLPAAWAGEGSFRGLCARGAYEVDCAWKDGKPVRVAVRAMKGGTPKVLFQGKPVEFALTLTGRRPAPRPVLAERLKDERMDVYGLIHFGPNTYTDREWGYGDEDPKAFDPKKFDADKIAAAAKAGGLGGIILVAKHHDGFCLWPTKTTDHNITRSPFRGGRGDLVKELETACRKAGLRFGVYVSPWDRHDAKYATADYVTRYHEQIRELLGGGYGEIFEMWFDGANGGDGWYGGAKEKRKITADYYRFDEIFSFVRELQPKICIFNERDDADFRWPGNEEGILEPDCRATVPHHDPGNYAPYMTWCADGTHEGASFHPPEADFPLRKGWFYHAAQDGQSKSGEYLMKSYLRTVGNGGTMNLGLSPNKDGELTDEDVAALRRFGEIRKAFFAKEAKADEPFNVIVMREDVSRGERVDAWEFHADGRRLLEGRAIGTKRICVLKEPVGGRNCELKVLACVDGEPSVSFRRYFVDPALLTKVLQATCVGGETDTAKWMQGFRGLSSGK